MKPTAEDFKDKLAGLPDKVIYVSLIKDMLKAKGYSCKISRRQTAAGRKIYFIIAPFPDYEDEYVSPWWLTSVNIIRTLFPESHLTSGNSDGWTIAEF